MTSVINSRYRAINLAATGLSPPPYPTIQFRAVTRRCFPTRLEFPRIIPSRVAQSDTKRLGEAKVPRVRERVVGIRGKKLATMRYLVRLV